MKVKFVFSYRKGKWNIFSRLISWASKFEKLGLEDKIKGDRLPSHVGVVVGNFVLESIAIKGVRIAPYEKWLECNEEVASIEVDLKMSYDEVYKRLTSVFGKKYDYIGVLFFAIEYIKLILFNKKMSEKNRWEVKDRFFCTEFVARLCDKDLSMHSPARLLKDMLDKKDCQ